MHAEARLPRHTMKGVAGIGIERESIDPQPGIAAGLVSPLPIIVGIADRAVGAQPEGVSVILAGNKTCPRRGDDSPAGQQRAIIVYAGPSAAGERARAPA